MNKTIPANAMLDYLKIEYAEAMSLVKDFGADDVRARNHIFMCIGMKEMCECLLCVPVNLRRDGKVTTGLDGEEVEI